MYAHKYTYTLQSMLHFANGGEDAYGANWVSGLNSLASFNTAGGAKSARRFLNIPDEIGGARDTTVGRK